MSKNIPTRLRNIYTLGQLGVVHEAADEIERLQRVISQLKGSEMCDPNDPCEMCKE
jgi:hypothetical protein